MQIKPDNRLFKFEQNFTQVMNPIFSWIWNIYSQGREWIVITRGKILDL